jgi:predicted HAD superfamily phosphohydrolase YqeG
MQLPWEALAVVGDQIFTDVLGANLKRLKCLFVFPIEHETTRFFRFKRQMERPFLPRHVIEA